MDSLTLLALLDDKGSFAISFSSPKTQLRLPQCSQVLGNAPANFALIASFSHSGTLFTENSVNFATDSEESHANFQTEFNLLGPGPEWENNRRRNVCQSLFSNAASQAAKAEYQLAGMN